MLERQAEWFNEDISAIRTDEESEKLWRIYTRTIGRYSILPDTLKEHIELLKSFTKLGSIEFCKHESCREFLDYVRNGPLETYEFLVHYGFEVTNLPAFRFLCKESGKKLQLWAEGFYADLDNMDRHQTLKNAESSEIENKIKVDKASSAKITAESTSAPSTGRSAKS